MSRRPRLSLISALLAWFPMLFRTRAGLLLENLTLRQQLAVLKRKQPRPAIGLLDRVIVFNEDHLRRLLRDCVAYCGDDQTHNSLGKDIPAKRPGAAAFITGMTGAMPPDPSARSSLSSRLPANEPRLLMFLLAILHDDWRSPSKSAEVIALSRAGDTPKPVPTPPILFWRATGNCGNLLVRTTSPTVGLTS